MFLGNGHVRDYRVYGAAGEDRFLAVNRPERWRVGSWTTTLRSLGCSRKCTEMSGQWNTSQLSSST